MTYRPSLRCCELFADLLAYPERELAGEAAVLAERLEEYPEARRAFQPFLERLRTTSLPALQELYTATFDLDPVCCPYVGYHLFGESYKRGALMAALKEAYGETPLDLGSELPDHLSCLLRFLALAEGSPRVPEIVDDLLVPALQRMEKVFGETADHPYRQLLRALLLWLEGERERERVQAVEGEGKTHD